MNAPNPALKMHAVIVVNLPTVSREEYEWALDQIERAATGLWAPDIDRRVHGSLDEGVVERVMSAFYPEPGGENDDEWAARVSRETVQRWGAHVEVPTRLASGKTYCSCGRPWPCAAAVKDLLWRYIDGRNIEARDSQLLNTALGVLQRHAQYGECSWHPGEYHGICSEAAR